MKSGWLTYIILIVLAMASYGCGTNKNTAASRKYTEFITRYNVHFNGNEHYRRVLSEMEKNYSDEFTRSTIFMHPAEAYADSKAAQPSGDFSHSIEKARKAIQLRSIKKRPRRRGGKPTPESRKWLKREEYNPFLHNSWLMLGRSQYMSGKFLEAASTFHYISKHFWWLPKTVTEASLWRARCYLAVDWLFEAEAILGSVKEKDLSDKGLSGLYAFDMAGLDIRKKNYAAAIPFLVEAIEAAEGSQKARLTFLLGQLYVLTGNSAQAYDVFKRVAAMGDASGYMRFISRIKQSEVFGGQDVGREIKSLRSLARYGSNKPYLDCIYYAIGNLYLSRGDTAQALENYYKSVRLSTRQGVDAALSELARGRIYFARGEYDKAQLCYSFAVGRLPDEFQDYNVIKSRSDVLDELAVYAGNVNLQDSLLKLSAMSPEEQRQTVDRIISDFEKREKAEAESRERAEYLAKQQAVGSGLDMSGANSPATFTLNTDRSWYFYNETARNAGRVEFQKRWGNRRLEDDWRRRNKNSFIPFESVADEISEGNEMQDDGLQQASETMRTGSDPHSPEYYLSQIPSTPAEKANASAIIQEGIYNMGVILKDKLADFGAATREFEELLRRFPDTVYRLDTYYELYLMGILSEDELKARHYRGLIMAEFPESKYAVALADPNYMENLRRMPQIEKELYEKAYEAYFNNRNGEVHDVYAIVTRDFPMSDLMPKFMFLEALSYVSENNSVKFADILRKLTERYPESDVAPLASSYLRHLAEGEQLNSGSGNVRGLVWKTRLSNDSTSIFPQSMAVDFGFRADTSQIVLLVYDVAVVSPKKLLFDVARHNFMSYSVRDFELRQMKFGQSGLLAVSGFNNRKEAENYRTRLDGSTMMQLPDGVIPVIISVPDFDLLLGRGVTLEEYFEAAGDDRIRRVHSDVLPPEEYDEPVIPKSPVEEAAGVMYESTDLN